MPDERGRLRCGEFGHVGKSGKPCHYVIYAPATACFHHDPADPGKTRQTEVLSRARQAAKESNTPEIETNGFKTIEDCLRVRALVVQELCSKPRPNMRALDMILKATSGASADHAVKAQERTNELLLMLDGHGAGIAVLQRLRDAPLRVLPGKRKVLDLTEVLEAQEPDKGSSPSSTPTESNSELQGA